MEQGGLEAVRQPRRVQGAVAATLELDHVLIAVADLAAAAHVLEARHGLASVEGGRHPDWGTANRIVPLGDRYLELVTVVDEATAASAPFGWWVAGTQAESRPIGWVVRTDGLDEVAGRLALEVQEGARRTATGDVLRWRSAGLEQAAAESCLPFFIEWGEATPFPGRARVRHPVGAVALETVALSGDAGHLDAWLSGAALPSTIRPGAPAVDAVVLRAAGEIRLDASTLRS